MYSIKPVRFALPLHKTSDVDFKSVLTLFAHEPSSVLIETFPRSGSTVILSNLALANLKVHTDYKKLNVNSIRQHLTPKKQLSDYQERVMLVRDPVERLESFYLTKLVVGEPKSVVAVGELIHKGLAKYPITYFKKLKGFFSSKENYDLDKLISSALFDSALIGAILETKKLVLNLSFDDMVHLFVEFGLPRDSHVYPQYEMKTFRLAEYSKIFNLRRFPDFVDWYEEKTGNSFSTKYNKTQPNNRLHLEKFPAHEAMKVIELQDFLSKNMTPMLGSISSKSTKKLIQKLFSRDYDMHLLSS